MTAAPLDSKPDAAEALARLERAIGAHSSLLVAYSGGVDSGVLLGVAARVLGERVTAITADSPSLSRRELREATIFARQLGVRHLVVATAELERPEYARNDRDRCFWCKTTLFEECDRVAAAEGFDRVAYGYNRDDRGDIRPGARAASKFGVIAPLDDAGLGKAEVRAVARLLGYELWDKPAAPCLSSRIPYGSAVTTEKLGAIEQMEDVMHDLGFRVFRARFDGTVMRLEIDEPELPLAVRPETRAQLNEKAAELHIGLLTLDLGGFSSGKLNRVNG